MGFSKNVKVNLLNFIFGKIVYSPETTFYLGLSSTKPSATGENISEPTDAAYFRLASGPDLWSEASDENSPAIKNLVDFIFIATEDWLAGEPVKYAILFMSMTGNDYLAYGEILEPAVVSVSESISLPATQLVLTFI